MKKKERKEIARQIYEEIKKGAYLSTQTPNQEFSQKYNLEDLDKTTILNATDPADEFIQQKNAESMQNNRAFANWIARIEQLEREIADQDERIIELEDTVKKQKKTINQLEVSLNEKIRTTDKKVKTVFEVIRNMGIAGGMFHSYIKKKDLPKETQKCANKRIRQNKKCEYFEISSNNVQWKGEK